METIVKGVYVQLSKCPFQGCCGMTTLNGFFIKSTENINSFPENPDNVVRHLQQEDVHEIYDNLMKELYRIEGGLHRMLLAADTDTSAQYHGGTVNSNTSNKVSLRGFCTYHGFRVADTLDRSGGCRQLNLYTFTPLDMDKRIKYISGPLHTNEWVKY